LLLFFCFITPNHLTFLPYAWQMLSSFHVYSWAKGEAPHLSNRRAE
jgi:hypothetical protein